jgi:hypothetical protein
MQLLIGLFAWGPSLIAADGNHVMTDGQIVAAMQSATTVDEAETAILELYWNSGFPLVSVNADTSTPQPILRITEGLRYRVGKVVMLGFPRDAQILMATRPGMWWSQRAISDDVGRLATMKVIGQVSANVNVHDDTRTIDMTFAWRPHL